MIAKLKERILGIELNPIVVKELRQAVRSWAVVGALVLLTVVLFFTVMGMIGFSNVSLNLSRPVGRNVLEVIISILNFVGIIFIPGYVGARVAVERQSENLDLLYISTLSPARIIRGKLLSGAYIALLFYSICLPFMFFTNLLRGVDLPTIAISVGFSFFLVLVSIQVAIFIAAIPLTRAFKVVIALGLLLFVIPMVMGFIFSSFRMFRSGIGSTIWSWAFWGDLLPWALIILSLVGLLHLLSIAMVTPPTANRALPIRIYVTIIWLVSGVTAYVGQTLHGGAFINVWTVSFSILGMLAFLVSVSESDHYSLRVRRDVPKNPITRRLAYFFYSGSGGGLAWSGIGLALTLYLAYLVVNNTFGTLTRPVHRVDDADWIKLVAVIFYVLAYSLFGAALKRWFFPRRPQLLASVIAVILPTMWIVIPLLLSFILNDFNFDILERFHPGDPVNVFMPRIGPYFMLHLACAAAMAAFGLAINCASLFCGMREFTPLRTEEEAKVG